MGNRGKMILGLWVPASYRAGVGNAAGLGTRPAELTT